VNLVVDGDLSNWHVAASLLDVHDVHNGIERNTTVGHGVQSTGLGNLEQLVERNVAVIYRCG